MNYIDFFVNDNQSGWKTREVTLTRRHPDLAKLINDFAVENKLEFLNFRERVFHFVYDLKEIPLCLVCGKPLKLQKSLKDGYGVYCSNKCVICSETRAEKIKQTNLLRYGTEYPVTTKEVKDKQVKTLMERYGVDNVFKLKEIQDKATQSMINKYGVNKAFKNKEIYAKHEEYCLAKYGTKTPLTLQTTKDKTKASWLEKSKIRFEGVEIISTAGRKFEAICDICKQNYSIDPGLFRYRYDYGSIICPHCNPIGGFYCAESKLAEMVSEISKDITIERNRRGLLVGKQEIDVYLPEFSIGLELNGLYWHSLSKRTFYYHKEKSINAINRNIRLFHVFEDEIDKKYDIIKSLTIGSLNMFAETVVVGEYIISEIEYIQGNDFLSENDLTYDGKEFDSYLGCFKNNELIGVVALTVGGDIVIEKIVGKLFIGVEKFLDSVIKYIKDNNIGKPLFLIYNLRLSNYLIGDEILKNEKTYLEPKLWCLKKNPRMYGRFDVCTENCDCFQITDSGYYKILL